MCLLQLRIEKIAARQSTRVVYTYPDFGGPTEIAFCEERGIHEEICVPESRAETTQRHVGFDPGPSAENGGALSAFGKSGAATKWPIWPHRRRDGIWPTADWMLFR